MIPKEAQDKLNAIASEYGHRLHSEVRKVFEGFRRSGQLTESATLTITKATDNEPPKIIVTYADQGYFIGSGSMKWTRLPNIEKLLSWSDSIQFSGPVPGYKDGSSLPPWKANERRIWAIAKSKQKFDKTRPVKWKRKMKLGDLLKNLNTETLAAYDQAAKEILTNALEGRTLTS